MMRTRANIGMERSRLEHLTLDQLKEDRLGLSTAGDRSNLIDAIMSFHERGNQPAQAAKETVERP